MQMHANFFTDRDLFLLSFIKITSNIGKLACLSSSKLRFQTSNLAKNVFTFLDMSLVVTPGPRMPTTKNIRQLHFKLFQS